LNSKIGKILLIVAPIIVAGFLLYPTYRASQLEQIEANYKLRAQSNPKDSAAIMDEFYRLNGESLESAKKGRLKLGLDLRGGMYVTLEVDVAQLIDESASEEAKDEIFAQVMKATREQAAMSDESVIDIFLKKFDQLARPKKKYLSDYFDFQTPDDLAKAEQKIQEKLKENETEAIDQAIQVIRQRVDKYGISEPTIQKQGSRRVLLELPGVTDEGKMLDLVKTTARLEFKGVANDGKLARAFYKIDKYLAEQAKHGISMEAGAKADAEKSLVKADSTKVDSTKAEAETNDTAKTEENNANPYANMSKEQAAKKYLADHPFTSLFMTRYAQTNKSASQEVSYVSAAMPDGEYNFMADEASMKKIQAILKRHDIKMMLPESVNLYFSAKPTIFKDNKGKDIKFFNFFACFDFQPKLTGDVITDAMATYDQTNNQPIVNMVMNGDGADRWAKITGANLGKRVAVILDDQVYTAPVVQSKIVGGSSQITGMENSEEAKMLKIVLKAGALKAPVQTAEVRVVGPSLGEDSINDGMKASLIAVALVIIFMLAYYAVAGFVANLAVIINVLLIFAVMAAFDGTLTLPGIAGIILTIGMAVDANILIYERIREELHHGRALRSAVDEGFKKALSAIVDSNVTTFITGLILFYFGSGSIQGFAMTLMIGILATLFTAILVSKAMIELMMKPGSTHFNFGQPKEFDNN
jgi:preprotein translocase subunit SecD